jgi:hypothetical protein
METLPKKVWKPYLIRYGNRVVQDIEVLNFCQYERSERVREVRE